MEQVLNDMLHEMQSANTAEASETEESENQLPDVANDEEEPWCRLFKKRLIYQGERHNILYPDTERDFLDIRAPQFRFGRDHKCEYVFDKPENLEMKWFLRVSKIHFVMYKDTTSEDSPIIIKDLSKNGTFVNGKLVGQNQIQVLLTGDVIGVAAPHIRLFDFRDFIVREHPSAPKDLKENFLISKKLGSGAFGVVYKVLDRKMNPFAVKFIGSQGESSFSEQEINIVRNIKHPCIIDTIDFINNVDGCYLILEYMGGGDLLSRIVNCPEGRLSEEQSRCIMFQIADAIKYLHRKKISHRDIKPENILLKTDEAFTLTKLTDFGLSKWVHSGTCLRSLLGTPNFTAPEILDKEIPVYTSKVDVWSLGVTLFAMLSGSLPFAEEYGDLRDQIANGRFQFLSPFWGSTSTASMRLISSMLIVDAEQRIDIDEIFERSWMDPKYNGIKMAKKLMGITKKRNFRFPRLRSGLRKIELDVEQDLAYPQPPQKKVRH
ncbi:ovarian-specific serine/threonine-protein kinase Lok-like [Culicoides brevitarsis]|uniref:ovarian-specific serine/threonine-protein kinase Lok-like n=1 Tax=Culicoides brevitarsis TaxID=469753 RepID=UPI00307C3832